MASPARSIPFAAAARRPTNRRRVGLIGEALIDGLPGGDAPGGAPFNVACHLAALGLEALLVTRVGADPDGEWLEREIASRGLSTRAVQRDPLRPTGRVTVDLAGGSPAFDIPPDQAFDAIEPVPAHDALAELRPSAVYFGTLAWRSEGGPGALSVVLRGIEAPAFVDLNLRAPWYDRGAVEAALEAAHVAKLSDGELLETARLMGLPDAPPFEQAATLCRRFSLARLFVTRGDQGVFVAEAGPVSVRILAAPAVAPPGLLEDTVGAGDAFSAVALAGMALDWPLSSVLERATALAGAVTRIRGALPSEPGFYAPFLAESREARP